MKPFRRMNLKELIAETRRLEPRLKEKGLLREERAILKAQLATIREHHEARISGAMSAIEAAKTCTSERRIMNIFILDPSPELAARAVDDRRVGAALKEVAQMLATASIAMGGTPPLRVNGQPYRPTHANHPCTRWVGSSRAAWEWTVAYAAALSAEHRARFGTAHRSYNAVVACDQGPKPTSVDAPLLFVIGMKNAAEPAGALLTVDRAVAVYRDYYRQAKGTTATYQRGRAAPSWMRALGV